MSQAAKAQEPSMEEILASIRRIIADDDGGKPAKSADLARPAVAAPQASPPPAAPPPPVAPPPPRPAAPAVGNSQEEVDAMLAEFETAAKPAASKPAPPPPRPPAPPEPAMAPSPSDVLDLTEAMTAPQSAPSFRTIDAATDVVFADRSMEMPSEPGPRSVAEPRQVDEVPHVDEVRRKFQPPAPDPALLSSTTAAAVDNAFNTLAHTVLGNNARTLEDLVKEMLRPMLKAWLDDNLPNLVERIVRTEIERVSRGRP